MGSESPEGSDNVLLIFVPYVPTSLVAQMVKVSAYNAGDLGSIPGLGRSPGEGNGNPLQYSCLENSMDRGVRQVTVYGVAESDMTEHTHTQSETTVPDLGVGVMP